MLETSHLPVSSAKSLSVADSSYGFFVKRIDVMLTRWPLNLLCLHS